jgi:hypothetical protein
MEQKGKFAGESFGKDFTFIMKWTSMTGTKAYIKYKYNA